MNNDMDFIQRNSPDGGFLQSEEWRKFQECVGRKTFNISGENFWANIIEHALPAAGKYYYVPRGPIIENQKSNFKNQNDKSKIQNNFLEMTKLAKDNNIGWIRIEPANREILDAIKNNTKLKIVKSPHDMQPRELLIIDITKSEEELLAEMKQKTRYNVRLAEKKGVSLRITNSYECTNKDIEEFLRLVKITARRDKIMAHPEDYYRKMFKIVPGDILKLYLAEYEGKVICANLVIFYGKTGTYLHGASDDEYRNVMAPFLLQWRQIQDAKKEGCEKYDFGGVRTQPHPNPLLSKERGDSWAGITRFKIGFSPNTRPTEFPGCYDLVLNQPKYWLYLASSRLMPIIKIFK